LTEAGLSRGDFTQFCAVGFVKPTGARLPFRAGWQQPRRFDESRAAARCWYREHRDGYNGGDRCMREKQNAERGQDESGLQQADHQECGGRDQMLNSASMQNEFSEGAFLLIQPGLEAIILFPCHMGIK
jgi:hypothetical protein